MAESAMQFQTALTDFSSFCGVTRAAGSKWVISFGVLSDPGNFRLLIQVTDTQTALWERRLSATDLQTHQNDLGLERVDWSMYFKLLKAGLSEKRVAVRPEGVDVLLEIEYPLAQAKIRGTLRIQKAQGDAHDIMNFVVGCLERALVPVENLKRERPPSPELNNPVQRVVLAAAKPALKRHKKVKELGSKIA